MSYAGIRARVESHTVTSWLRSVTRTFAVRYPLTLLFAVAIILILSIGSWILISKTAQGANKQLIHTLETEIEKDLAGDLDRLRLSGVDISIDLQDSADQLDTWIAEVSKDIGASVAVLFDLDGIPIWSSNPAYPESGDLEADNVEIALAGGVVTELEFDVRLVGTDGRYYISGAMETYLPLFTASGDTQIGVLEVYVDVREELKAASAAARSNISESVIEVMVVIGMSLLTAVFIAEVLLHRARRRRDEMERKRAETASELSRVEARSRESEIARQERERFLSVVSHELKTPLTSVLAFTDIVKNDRDGALTERQLKHLGLVSRNGRRLAALIDDVLDVSRIETGRLSLEMAEFEIDELFDDLMLSLDGIFQERTQDLVFAPPAGDYLIMADRSRIFQAVSNLLSNASKYSPENSTITFRGLVEKNRLRISVTDEGFGLTENDQQRVFDLFYRASNEQTRTVAGLGVGLAIVRSIIESHKGSVDVDSVPGKGSTYTIEIPGVIAQPQAAQQAA